MAWRFLPASLPPPCPPCGVWRFFEKLEAYFRKLRTADLRLSLSRDILAVLQFRFDRVVLKGTILKYRVLYWKIKFLGYYLRAGAKFLGWSMERQNEIFYTTVENWLNKLIDEGY